MSQPYVNPFAERGTVVPVSEGAPRVGQFESVLDAMHAAMAAREENQPEPVEEDWSVEDEATAERGEDCAEL